MFSPVKQLRKSCKILLNASRTEQRYSTVCSYVRLTQAARTGLHSLRIDTIPCEVFASLLYTCAFTMTFHYTPIFAYDVYARARAKIPRMREQCVPGLPLPLSEGLGTRLTWYLLATVHKLSSNPNRFGVPCCYFGLVAGAFL